MSSPASNDLDKTKVSELIIDAIRDANQLRGPDQKITESASAPLFGGDGVLDSLGLVSLLMDVEEMLDAEGVEVSLSSEHAMSQHQSPYRDVSTLADYIVELAKG